MYIYVCMSVFGCLNYGYLFCLLAMFVLFGYLFVDLDTHLLSMDAYSELWIPLGYLWIPF